VNGWKLRWYTARALIGCGEAYLPWEDLRQALLKSGPQETRWTRVTPASGSLVEVKILTRARHAGAAAGRLADFLASAVPAGWDWAGAAVEAALMPEGVRRWPRLAVLGPGSSEVTCADAAVQLASQAVAHVPEAQAREALLEVLQMCGLTLSAGGSAR
jgi:hypothetical protein